MKRSRDASVDSADEVLRQANKDSAQEKYGKEVLTSFGEVARCASQDGRVECITSLEKLNERYRSLVKVGEGTFGEVFIVYDTVRETYLTMKKLKRLFHTVGGTMAGVHMTTFREISLLSTISHPNIVRLLDVHVIAEGWLVVLFPIVAHDLVTLREWPGGLRRRLSVAAVKCVLRQLLEAVAHLHRHKVLHRDIKANNVMVGHDGVVKLIDFGWARYRPTTGKMTGPPCILSMRAPELLVGKHNERNYDLAVDIWSCGCLLFNLLTDGQPFVRAHCVADALTCIVDWLGSPPARSHTYYGPKVAVHVEQGRVNTFSQRCSALFMQKPEQEFLQMLLQWEPSQRPAAKDLLAHEWFTMAPLPCRPSELPVPPCSTYGWLDEAEAQAGRSGPQ
ncbi:protein kinase [Strigomonas culicis]|uniref:Protein kinase n=1 Tax=Strigomonas culicis TaxID=28005 RepID=S9WHH8_9TRYP|nr:protein kinase [Strigomonas culicis]|eukprot:EPY35280.1 protein kinase [Strigomonas culicis]